ncbi:carbohydrate ABC transporter permease [Paenibacillus sp. FSL H8-0034]|uniref:carbohydrate ABC transporter permease n=1 Tax=Paenibacillus sp. FSL H8-0034 TaxID=2954671 RepID=UPI0030F88AC1
MVKIARFVSLIPHMFLLLMSIACIFPVVLVVSTSLSNLQNLYTYGYTFIPKQISWDAYSYIFLDSAKIFRAYGISIFVTIVGTCLSVLLLAMIAYPLSRRSYVYNRPLMLFVFFTMLFNGGLVPFYIVVTRYLHLKDSIWALILPYLIVPWFVLLMRTFFQSIPGEIIEAAKVDGCSEYRIFFGIILPLSRPALATIALLSILKYWNDWWLGLLFIDNEQSVPLQLMLYRIMTNIQELARAAAESGIRETIEFPAESARMAIAVIVAGPMLFVFPFFQKYFVTGLTVGAIKG